VNEPERHNPAEWVVGDLSGLADVIRDRTPEPLRRRGILISEEDLLSVWSLSIPWGSSTSERPEPE
jgi:hypothetical protein